MNDQELRDAQAVRRALSAAFLTVGTRPFPGSDAAIAAKLAELDVICDLSLGYLRLTQSGTPIEISGACERIRKELPQLFSPDPRRDAVSCRQDLERGSPDEIARAKSAYISQHGLASWAALPQTRAEAETKTAPVNLDMTRAQWLALPFAERARLSGVIGPDALSKIMTRKG